MEKEEKLRELFQRLSIDDNNDMDGFSEQWLEKTGEILDQLGPIMKDHPALKMKLKELQDLKKDHVRIKKNELLPDKFAFNSKIIVITNMACDKIDGALLSRAMVEGDDISLNEFVDPNSTAKSKLLLVCGSPATGKTPNITSILKDTYKMKEGVDYSFNTGEASKTAAKLLAELYNNREDMVIVFDDADDAVINPDTRQLLMSATDTSTKGVQVMNDDDSKFTFSKDEVQQRIRDLKKAISRTFKFENKGNHMYNNAKKLSESDLEDLKLNEMQELDELEEMKHKMSEEEEENLEDLDLEDLEIPDDLEIEDDGEEGSEDEDISEDELTELIRKVVKEELMALLDEEESDEEDEEESDEEDEEESDEEDEEESDEEEELEEACSSSMKKEGMKESKKERFQRIISEKRRQRTISAIKEKIKESRKAKKVIKRRVAESAPRKTVKRRVAESAPNKIKRTRDNKKVDPQQVMMENYARILNRDN